MPWHPTQAKTGLNGAPSVPGPKKTGEALLNFKNLDRQIQQGAPFAPISCGGLWR
jgi:hypothetical protein